MNIRANEIQQLNPGGLDQRHSIRPQTSRLYIRLRGHNHHRVWSPTDRHAIKEESAVINRDWVDHQACSMSQYTYGINNVLIMRN